MVCAPPAEREGKGQRVKRARSAPDTIGEMDGAQHGTARDKDKFKKHVHFTEKEGQLTMAERTAKWVAFQNGKAEILEPTPSTRTRPGVPTSATGLTSTALEIATSVSHGGRHKNTWTYRSVPVTPRPINELHSSRQKSYFADYPL